MLDTTVAGRTQAFLDGFGAALAANDIAKARDMRRARVATGVQHCFYDRRRTPQIKTFAAHGGQQDGVAGL